MKDYFEVYSAKSEQELLYTLAQHTKLTLVAKLGLRKTLKERGTSSFELQNLDRDIETRMKEIDELRFLGNLGLEYIEHNNGAYIKKSRTLDRGNTYAIIMGFLLSTTTFYAVKTWIKILYEGEHSIMTVLFALISTIIAITGMSIMSRTIDRIWFYKSFEIKKSEEGVSVKYRPDLVVRHIRYSNRAKLAIHEHEDGKTNLVVLEPDEVNERVLIEYLKMEYISKETLKSLVAKFNKELDSKVA